MATLKDMFREERSRRLDLQRRIGELESELARRRVDRDQRIRQLEIDLQTTQSLYRAAIDRNEVLARKLKQKAA